MSTIQRFDLETRMLPFRLSRAPDRSYLQTVVARRLMSHRMRTCGALALRSGTLARAWPPLAAERPRPEAAS
eukprot:6179129-Pleurochrysis_carterae.AAC.1